MDLAKKYEWMPEVQMLWGYFWGSAANDAEKASFLQNAISFKSKKIH
jgi:hypothetical protein